MEELTRTLQETKSFLGPRLPTRGKTPGNIIRGKTPGIIQTNFDGIYILLIITID